MRELDELAGHFWTWRARQQPRTRDDIPRLERPEGWLPEVDPALGDQRAAEHAAFTARLARIRPPAGDVPAQVDRRLLRSALARVTWETGILRVQSVPRYWTDQALGPVFDALLRPGVDQARVTEVIRLLRAAPATLAHAPAALRGAAREYAALALAELGDISAQLDACAAALARIVPAAGPDLRSAAADAASATRDYARWLTAAQPGLPPAVPVGPERYQWFLREVACVPYPLGEIESIGRREYDRAVWLELLYRNRAGSTPEPPLPDSAEDQSRAEAAAETQVRRFYERHGLLTQPRGLGRYLARPMPDYLEPLRFLGMADDLTGPSRLRENGVGYIPAPGPHLPYFYAANARDPRAGIIHEGVHYQQLARSWSHPRPVRRHYYDSGANEGIAFYNEEMMLASGLLDDAPHTRTAVCNFMRLRALRVTVDVGLATGALTIDDAAAELASRVPMDAATAREEAAFFAETPGQALTYQVGKTQLIALLADAARTRGPDLDLRQLHDAIWLNGNVPLALLRWELLGLTDELPAIGLGDAA